MKKIFRFHRIPPAPIVFRKFRLFRKNFPRRLSAFSFRSERGADPLITWSEARWAHLKTGPCGVKGALGGPGHCPDEQKESFRGGKISQRLRILEAARHSGTGINLSFARVTWEKISKLDPFLPMLICRLRSSSIPKMTIQNASKFFGECSHMSTTRIQVRSIFRGIFFLWGRGSTKIDFWVFDHSSRTKIIS